MPKRVLFLDVDGVLHPLRLMFKDGKVIDEHCFQKSCCEQLKKVVQATGAEIVLSSSWRCHAGSRDKLQDALRQWGLGFTRWTTTNPLDGKRASQVLRFVSDHAAEIEGWAVVDDEDLLEGAGDGLMLQVFAQRFVRTDCDLGLNVAQADKLIAILNSADGEEED
eukprot:CAMPEP_0119107342 /NCGR_PEP_ID=MMETSP1180-20130426/9652_1 /TAXON_ID=3052 ORGANISM="Chlamydomonas cf sp, Strain CCMP681" /NCGR_SAMPLE_ID=MMETSP1180 /ASSEMBLY_ACC=CAM_ASM_000741 /LENGTH=164 /DNA_ID=CAMNT_0007092815 /DNA_START=72 /DNA_END=566 /DNA_ORIENTATION=+